MFGYLFDRYKALALIAISLFVMIFINYMLYTHSTYIFGGDQPLFVPTYTNLLGSFFIWEPYNYTGLTTTPSSILNVLLYLIDLLFYSRGILFGYLLSNTFYFWVGAFGMFLLVFYLAKDFDKKLAYLGGIISSIMFVINFDSYVNNFSMPLIFIPYFVLFVFLSIKKIEKGENSSILFAGLVLALSSFFATGYNSNIIQNFVFSILFILLLILLSQSKRIRQIKYFGSAVLLSLLINFSWIITTYIFINNKISSLYFNPVSNNILRSSALQLPNSLLLFGPMGSSWTNIFMFTLFIISIIGIYLASKNVKFSKSSKKIVLSLLASFILFLGISTTVNKPFGIVFQRLVSIIHALDVLRYPYPSLHYLSLFFMSVIFGIAFIFIYDKLKTKNIKIGYLFLILVMVLVIVYVYNSDYIPIIAKPLYVSNIPYPVYSISNYINSQNGTFSVITLPSATSWQHTSWYLGVNVYSAFINKPVYTGGYTNYMEIFYPPSYNIESVLSEAIDTSNITQLNLSGGLGTFGIKYIIIQGDSLINNCDEYCSVFSFNTIYSNLNNSKSIYFVKKFGNSSIYENSNYVPLVYGSDLLRLKNITSTNIIDIIESNSFNLQNTSIYEGSIGGFYNDSNTINATPITNFSKPNLTFIENTPTKVTVHVSNAITPYYLVFRETYDPHWAAFYSNGTEVNPRDHIAVNGFSNAWYMNKTGNYTVTLYYTLQTDAWIAWGVSFAALFVTIGIGVYGWKEMKKEKMRSRR